MDAFLKVRLISTILTKPNHANVTLTIPSEYGIPETSSASLTNSATYSGVKVTIYNVADGTGRGLVDHALTECIDLRDDLFPVSALIRATLTERVP